MKRIAFFMGANQSDWLGGLSYLRNLLRAVYLNPDRSIEAVLFVHPAMEQRYFAGFPDVQIIATSLVNNRHMARLAGRVICSLIDRDLTLEFLLRKHRIDALSHSFTAGSKSNIPTISWIPDFQHIHMPHNFSQSELDVRDRFLRRLVKGSRRIILSSHCARNDFASFAPRDLPKTRVMHFVSGFDDVGATISYEKLCSRFSIHQPFFHLPNQFWTHKNHLVIVEALGILLKQDVHVLVLATGKTGDHRDPKYFEQLMARVKKLGVQDSFRPLGIVTLPELQSLMVNAISLINPSNFEGWSTTVEESKSLGLPIILSDIPVHIEQAPSLGHYFKAGSAEDLAEVMLATIREHDPAVAAKRRKVASLALTERVKQFGEAYEEIVKSTLADNYAELGVSNGRN